MSHESANPGADAHRRVQQKDRVMFSRSILVASLIGLLMLSTWPGARAQQPTSQPPSSGWSFNIAPYLWLPQIRATVNYNLPPALGGRLPTEVTTGPGEYLPNLNFATALSADARFDRFSLLTDFMYTNVNGDVTTIKSLDFFGLPSHPIDRTLQLSATSRLAETIWTLEGGYTVFQGDWGYFDVLAGFRYLGVNATTNYSLALSIVGPRGNGATFGGVGGISGSRAIWNGIAGFRGRFNIANTGLFVPYYFDIGGGGSSPTWQISSGLGYQFNKWGSASVLYRYLAFDQGNSSVIQHLSLGGPVLMVSFSF
jgi:hypothetical protein